VKPKTIAMRVDMGVILKLEPKKAKNLKRVGERLKTKESKRVSYGGEIKKTLQHLPLVEE